MATPIGRKRAQLRLQADTRPGQALLLGLLAAAPIALAFVFLPALTGGTSPLLMRVALYATPVLAGWGLVVFVRTPTEVRAHNAAKLGSILAVVSLLLWVLILIPALQGRL